MDHEPYHSGTTLVNVNIRRRRRQHRSRSTSSYRRRQYMRRGRLKVIATSLNKQNEPRSGRIRKRGKRLAVTPGSPNLAVVVTIQTMRKTRKTKTYAYKAVEVGFATYLPNYGRG
jgi:hypothetical protein